ncbi:hypothetical protein T484DRAFT_3228962 [Baffinella frigidus]|nr:hypothetical protein T484DRAFT_3228962 [Cryptophyta sp. CCMP2293]
MTSKTRTVTTLDDLKKSDEAKLILKSSQYQSMLKLINDYENKIEEFEHSSKVDDVRITLYKEQILTLGHLALGLKKQLDDRNTDDTDTKKTIEQYQENLKEINKNVKTKLKDKYSDLTADDLMKEALSKVEPLENGIFAFLFQ